MKVELFLDFDDILYLVCASRLENTLCEPTTLFCVSIGVIIFIHKCVCICVFVYPLFLIITLALFLIYLC